MTKKRATPRRHQVCGGGAHGRVLVALSFGFGGRRHMVACLWLWALLWGTYDKE